MTTLIVEADLAFRQLLSTWLVASDDVTLLGVAESEPEGLVLARERLPDVVLLALELLSEPDVRRTEPLNRRYPDSQVLILVPAAAEDAVVDALRDGASGYIIKEDASPASLTAALRTVCRGEAVLSPRIAGIILDQIADRTTGGS